MRELKFRLRIGNDIMGYERWCKGNDSTAHWEHLKRGETVWRPAFLYATEKDSFIGLHDKNGKEVYEGDIIKMLSRNLSQVYFQDSGFCVDVGGLITGLHSDYLGRYRTVEVVGNIYENSELLEEGEKCMKKEV